MHEWSPDAIRRELLQLSSLGLLEWYLCRKYRSVGPPLRLPEVEAILLRGNGEEQPHVMYALTAVGGKVWEHAVQVRWTCYHDLSEYSLDDGRTHVEIYCGSADHLAEVLAAYPEYYNIDHRYGMAHQWREDVENWAVSYWKTLPMGFGSGFDCIHVHPTFRSDCTARAEAALTQRGRPREWKGGLPQLSVEFCPGEFE